jgi:hypothetical protein
VGVHRVCSKWPISLDQYQATMGHKTRGYGSERGLVKTRFLTLSFQAYLFSPSLDSFLHMQLQRPRSFEKAESTTEISTTLAGQKLGLLFCQAETDLSAL